ncbi:hypothetical protein D9M68_980960 [compost metagenome]
MIGLHQLRDQVEGGRHPPHRKKAVQAAPEHGAGYRQLADMQQESARPEQVGDQGGVTDQVAQHWNADLPVTVALGQVIR